MTATFFSGRQSTYRGVRNLVDGENAEICILFKIRCAKKTLMSYFALTKRMGVKSDDEVDRVPLDVADEGLVAAR